MLKDSLEMRAEECFLRYAFPCAYILEERGEISKEELHGLKKSLYSGEVISREDLQKIFHRAYDRIQRYAGRENIWDTKLIRKYFREGHNDYIDQGDGDYKKFEPEFREFCKVFRGAVVNEIELKGKYFVEVVCGNRRIKAFNDLVRAKKGDVVYVHQNMVAEKE